MKEKKKIIRKNITLYVDGRFARHKRIVPKLATSYLTTSGKSFSKYTSICEQRLVHLIKYPRFFKENSP